MKAGETYCTSALARYFLEFNPDPSLVNPGMSKALAECNNDVWKSLFGLLGLSWFAPIEQPPRPDEVAAEVPRETCATRGSEATSGWALSEAVEILA